MTDARVLLEMLARRRDAYGRMLVAAPADAELRRGLLAEVERIDRAIDPVRERWDDVRAALDPSQVGRIEELVEETRGILAELVRREEQRLRSASELGPILARRGARAAYGP